MGIEGRPAGAELPRRSLLGSDTAADSRRPRCQLYGFGDARWERLRQARSERDDRYAVVVHGERRARDPQLRGVRDCCRRSRSRAAAEANVVVYYDVGESDGPSCVRVARDVCVVSARTVSNAGAVALRASRLQTVAGLGVHRVGRPRAIHARELLRRAAVAPLAGMAWTGVVARDARDVRFAAWTSRASSSSTVGDGWRWSSCGVARDAPVAGRPRAGSRARRTRSWAENAAVAASRCALGAVRRRSRSQRFGVKPLAEYDGWAMWGMKAPRDRRARSGGRARVRLARVRATPPRVPAPPPRAPRASARRRLRRFASNTIVLSCLAVGARRPASRSGAFLRDRVRPSVLLPTAGGNRDRSGTPRPARDRLRRRPAGDARRRRCGRVQRAGCVDLKRWLWLVLSGRSSSPPQRLTKNEGLLFAAVAYVLSLGVVASGRRRPCAALRRLIVALAVRPLEARTSPHHDLGVVPTTTSRRPSTSRWIDRATSDRVPDRRSRACCATALGPSEFGLLAAPRQSPARSS